MQASSGFAGNKIVVELDPTAPITVQNFVDLVERVSMTGLNSIVLNLA